MADFNKYKFNLEKSPLDIRDYMLESIYPESVVLPEVWDLRPQLRQVRDQGTQGTCSAQTASCMKEWQESADVEFDKYMSPQFIYNLRPNQGSEGMYPRDTMEILRKIGSVPENLYPYGTNKKISESLLHTASNYVIEGYAQIGTVDSLKKALFANGPCYIAFPVYNANKMEFWKQDFPNQPMLGGHAVTVVGYLKDKFIIRNSWSIAWGDNGYTYLSFADWGLQWECWTTIDADSNPQSLKDKAAKVACADKMGWFKRLFQKKLQK